MSSILRVREVISDSKTKTALRRYLPKDCIIPPPELVEMKVTYPTTLMKLFPSGDSYKILGFVTEYLLSCTPSKITIGTLKSLCIKFGGSDIEIPDKTLKLKSTTDYLNKVKSTRVKLEELLATGVPQYDITLQGENVEGHPDIKLNDNIYEVKTTGRIKHSWPEFIYQVFAYAALDASCKRIHLVLPLQETIWSFDLSVWTDSQRGAFKTVLERSAIPKPTTKKTGVPGASGSKPTPTPADLYDQMLVLQELPLGIHAPKLPTLAGTVDRMIEHDPYIPYQIFLGSPTSFSYKQPSEKDISKAAELLKLHHIDLFIHAPYVINLADSKASDETYIPLILKQLKVGEALGAKGVVIHVGKSVKQNPEAARNNMKRAVHEILFAMPPDAKCPLLIETPAGQGTELLTKYEEFRDFALEVMAEGGYSNSTFGVCIDTCHVFATGYDPAKYIADTLADSAFAPFLKLIHFNDSKDLCGSCVDRHAQLYCGHIPVASLNEVAALAELNTIPLVRE